MKDCTLRSFVSAGTLAVATLFCSAGPGRGGENGPAALSPTNARPTAAVIALDGSPLAALFEARLIENRRAAWLERVKIDAILREQKLTALLAPESGRQRAEVGQLLKADVLVLFEQTAKPEPHVRLVVCETRQGLRLAVRQVVLSADAQSDVRQLTELADQALANLGQEVREIVAVPPFVCNDLTYEHEYLKGAYAKLAELAVSGRPGLVSVELKEAQAIGRELAIAGERQLEARALPLYLLGEYRHEGKDEKRTATIRMRMMRGEQVLASREASGLASADGVRFVQQAAAELIEKSAGVRPMAPDAKIEAKQLASRAEVFFQLGNWEEATALAEASLLLDGSQQRMREVAILSLAAVARDHFSLRKDAETVAYAIHCYLRGLEHYEALLLPSPATREGSLGLLFSSLRQSIRWHVDSRLVVSQGSPRVVIFPGRPRDLPEAVWEVEQDLRKSELDIIMRMFLARCRAGGDDSLEIIILGLASRSEEESFEIAFEAIRAIQGLPDAERLSRALIARATGRGLTESPTGGVDIDARLKKYDELLSSIEDLQVRAAVDALWKKHDILLSSVENPRVRAAVPDESRRRFLLGPASSSNPPRTSSQTIVDPTRAEERLRQSPVAPLRLRFEPIELSTDWPLPPPSSSASDPCPSGWTAIGHGTDVVLGKLKELYLSRLPGQLTRILSFVDMEPRFEIRDLAYDGRFVWISAAGIQATPRLMILDPQTQRLFEVAERDGLPVMDWTSVPEVQRLRVGREGFWIAPLEPGKVVLASWFGRLAIGTVTFDPDQGPTVDLFFEARHAPDPTDAEPWRDSQLAFMPSYAISLCGASDDGQPVRKVFVAPATSISRHKGRNEHPLVVDPHRRQVEVLGGAIEKGLDVHRLVFQSDAVYRLQPDTLARKSSHLERIGLPMLTPETLMTDLPFGYLLEHGDRFIVLGRGCWLLDVHGPPEDRIRRVAVQPPGEDSYTMEFPPDINSDDLPYGFRNVWRSSHYGVVFVRHTKERGHEYFRLVIEDQPPTP